MSSTSGALLLWTWVRYRALFTVTDATFMLGEQIKQSLCFLYYLAVQRSASWERVCSVLPLLGVDDHYTRKTNVDEFIDLYGSQIFCPALDIHFAGSFGWHRWLLSFPAEK